MNGFYSRLKVLPMVLCILSHLSSCALAGCPPSAMSGGVWNPANLQTMAYALGLLMVVVQGLRYIIADSAQERADVKKGLIYVVVGLLVVSGYTNLTNLYCDIAGIT